MDKLIKNLPVLCIIIVSMVFFSCKNTSEFEPSGSYLGRSECGNIWKNAADQRVQYLFEKTPNEIVQYSYQNNILKINHINAGFNCCPEIISEIDIIENIIVISETELKALCSCLCLFTLKYEIKNLIPGFYKIKIDSPYIPDDEQPVELEIELFEGAGGSMEFIRTGYPWI